MSKISAREFFLWEKKQLLKGGNKQSLSLLMDLIGGTPHYELTLKRLTLDGKLYFKENLDFIESIWDNHLKTQYLFNIFVGLVFGGI